MAEIRNPGWAGETGDFEALSESDIRGAAYVGERPRDGGHPGAACSLPYQLVERDPDAPLFEGAYGQRLEKILSRYPDKRAALLPVLNMAQEIRGYLSEASMDQVAHVLELPPAYVRGVATFYTMYNKRPVGRHLIQVCTNVACNLAGGDEVLDAFLEHTDTETGAVSRDGLFTVIEVECLGACGFPTAVQINSRYFENVEAEAVPEILEQLRAESGEVDTPSHAVASEAGDGSLPRPDTGAGRGTDANRQED